MCDIDEIKPVIIFTRRRALAREIEENLRNKLDLKISLITGGLEKRKRVVDSEVDGQFSIDVISMHTCKIKI